MHKSSDVSKTLIRAVAELRALERYLAEVIELQQHEQDLRRHPTAEDLLREMSDVANLHVAHLDKHLQNLHSGDEPVRQCTASMAGAFLAFITKTRAHEVSKILRDDYTLLNLVSANYLILHASAAALGATATADLASDHQHRLAPLLQEISQLLPQIVVRDLARAQEAHTAPQLRNFPAAETVPPFATVR